MIIYMTINLINNKFYIGKDKNNNPKYLGSGIILKKSILKYGKENFFKTILEECEDEIKLSEREIYWIEFFEANIFGYNIAKGGEGGDTISNHPDKLNISEIHSEKMKLEKYNYRKGKKFGKLSDEIKEKLRICNLGKSWGNHTEEAKNKISKKAIGRIVSAITREKISDANKGKIYGKHSVETIKIMSEVKLGDKNPMYGKTHTNEVKKIISEINSHPKSENTKCKLSESLKNYYKSGNKPTNTKKIHIEGKIYNGYTEAINELGLTLSKIRSRIKSKLYPTYYHIT